MENQIDHKTSIWLVRLRWCALVFGIFALHTQLNSTLAISAAILLISNIFASRGLTEKGVGLTLLLDILLLTAVLSVTGGPANPFSVLYLVHITLTAAVLGSTWTWIVACFAVSAFGSLFIFNTASHAHHGSFADHLKGMWIAFALASALIAYFVSKILTSLKSKEQQVAKMQIELEKSSKFASLVTLSAGAAHELGTPISTIALISSELARNKNPEIADDIKILLSEVNRCRKILEEMRHQADIASPEQWQLVSHQELKNCLKEANLNFTKLPNPCLLPLNGLTKTLNSIIRNAIDAKADKIIITASLEQNILNFRVADSGTGMTKQDLERSTEPFFTTKATGKGMGLGLFLARIFSEQLGGRLLIESEPNKGCTVTISFPTAKQLKVANA